jgi:hypothetical protein
MRAQACMDFFLAARTKACGTLQIQVGFHLRARNWMTRSISFFIVGEPFFSRTPPRKTRMPDPKYVASTRPINSRTAGKQSLRAPVANPIAQERLAAIKIRNRFGAPLSEQLRLPRPTRQAMSPWLVVGSVLVAVSAIGLILAWSQSSLSFAGRAVGLIAGLGMIMIGRRASVDRAPMVPAMQPLFDEETLHAFDRVVEQLAPEAPEVIAAQLLELKQQILRIARLAATSSVDEHFTMDDRMYLTESVRRYLPDSLQSYLLVPADHRAAPIPGQEQSAVSMLNGQLNLLQAELAKREEKLMRGAAEDLLKQQRFLESKVKR